MYRNLLERFKSFLLLQLMVAKYYWGKVPSQSKKIIKVVGIAIGLSLFSLIIFSAVVTISKKRTPVVVNVVPSEVPQTTAFPEEKIFNPSRYATDSAILKIEEDLKSVEKELNDLEINEVDLLPPKLDFELNFDK